METETEAKPITGFRKYDHLEKQGHRNTRGIEEGRTYVFPKIDGTNACVWSDGETVFAGSRNRQLSLEADNAGFLAFVLSDDARATALREIVLANPDLVFYGEWLVPHSLKTYHQDAWRRFWIFDVFRRTDTFRGYLDFETYAGMLETTGIDFIDPLAIYNNATGAQLKDETETNDFLIMEGHGVGEGVVVKNYEWRNEGSHDRVWGKFVRAEFKAGHRRTMGAPTKEGKTEVERVIAEEFVTPTLVEKNLAKVALIVADSEPQGNMMERDELLITYRGRIIPQLLGRVWNDLIEEEMWTILKKHKGATIDFKRLQNLATVQIKSILPDLFS
tara:strand:- start:38809 stop:39804 length:996 start_codon:yes stop_codon:yes gene_type:complete